MRLRVRTLLPLVLPLAAAAVTAGVTPACYPAAGEGVDPPAFSFYFPVGFAVSRGGNVLYAINSDFDLQWNGGTIQSLDLHLIRRHTVAAIKDPTDPNLPLALPSDPNASCPNGPPVITNVNDAGVEPGWACAPPTNASFYMRDSVAIGAFATDLQLSIDHEKDAQGNPTNFSRLFAPIRGDASLTWAEVQDDDPNVAPLPTDTADTFAPFQLGCGVRDAHRRCDRNHRAGNDANQPGNTRHITMPGEPFGMAQSEDGQAIVITHQTDTESTLFTPFTRTGADILSASPPIIQAPAIQFVVGGLPAGGIGVAAVPHDPLAYPECFPDATTPQCQAVFPRPAFLQTSRSAGQLALLRFYSDMGDQGASSLFRPFLQEEAVYNLNVNAGTTDFARGIAIDPSPRIRCLAKLSTTDPDFQSKAQECARRPARVFIASRGPASLIVGEVGAQETQGGTFNPDLVTFTDSIPLGATSGPSAVKIAPVVDQKGNLALRVFVVCFDAHQIIDYDPDQKLIEAVINVGLGPFALAFDPFNFADAAVGKHVDVDPRDADIGLKKYRFAYVGSFTQSYMQVIDLDNSTPDKSTWATVVYTVGVPTPPKGS